MKVILVDDERLALEYLEHQLLKIEGVEIIGKYTNPIDGAKVIKNNAIDIIFLDIQMPEVDGLALAEKLLEQSPRLNIVFVKAYEEYAVKAFEINAIDYLLKPINKDRLLKTINRIKDKEEGLFKNKNNQYKENLNLKLFRDVRLENSKGGDIDLKWRTAKAEQVFLYLLQNKGLDIHRDKIIELMWQGVEINKATQQLYTAVYQMRRTLSDYNKNFKIKSTQRGYMLVLNNIKIDVDEFTQLVSSNKRLNKKTIKDYERAVEIANGEYLEGYDYIWCEIERQRLILMWLKAMKEIINWHYKNNQLDKAISFCFSVLNRYPLEEEIYLSIMRIFSKQNKNLEIHEYYKQLQSILLEEMAEQPNKEISKWYEKWQELQMIK